VDIYLKRLEENARTLQIWYTWLQLALLISSAVTAAMASVDIVPRWAVSISGVIAAIAGGAITTFKIQDRIYANRKAVAEIQLECQKYDYQIDEQRFLKFSRNINLIRGEQMLQEVEFWKPHTNPHSKYLY
jgi:hypothetical protein